MKNDFPSASILKDNRICFNIKGNNYRLIVKINCDYQMMWIMFIGTHAEYDKIDANKIENNDESETNKNRKRLRSGF